ncbi:hypothetical protein M2163_000390 [Streptomyces sp. SAI-135]|jgi:hypothetical protein|uniref:hypothetical protein n=1 Tax=unclassified Streptomyces TaxID=2593676 RepID=UPI0024733D67|nr:MULTISPECIES: hypothetical protein [unclassified Streptomyces]MDH6523104.1 hypothetical protein [Streptomyces sp. SAI-090]MDH6554714.1 hypothetical protein [Streptomyces sp. SAI-041]MDH6573988.1 hypothetical protein [Streptomyces sp. SAI-117]MDH6581276.1 hypothetical protein [Streptomyces sp. SAI-133]MDH6613282.1 hypothetical protein [Streptomyces sp. SAI-135]
MDPALLALASAGGAALVQAMATDAWTAVRDGAARVLGRGDADRESRALERLDLSHNLVSQSDLEGEAPVRAAESARWSERLEVLLDEHPDQVEEVRSLVVLMRDALGEPLPGSGLTQHISAGRDAYVAGRDQSLDMRRPAGDSHD